MFKYFALGAAVALIPLNSAAAVDVSWTFTGKTTIYSSNVLTFGNVNVGTPFTAKFIFDDSMPSSATTTTFQNYRVIYGGPAFEPDVSATSPLKSASIKMNGIEWSTSWDSSLFDVGDNFNGGPGDDWMTASVNRGGQQLLLNIQQFPFRNSIDFADPISVDLAGAGYAGGYLFHDRFDILRLGIDHVSVAPVVPPPTAPKTYGLFVGVRDALNHDNPVSEILADLRGDISAKRLLDAFTDLPNTIGTLLTADIKAGEAISAGDISSAIAQIKNQMSAGDKFFLYISGHGDSSTSEDTDTNNGQGDEYVLLGPWQDQSSNGQVNVETLNHALYDNQLYSILNSHMAGIDKTVFLDVCHSGGFYQQFLDPHELSFNNPLLGDLEQLDRIAFLSATDEFNKSYYSAIDFVPGDGSPQFSSGLPLISEALYHFWKSERASLRPEEMHNYIKNFSENNPFYVFNNPVFQMGFGSEIYLESGMLKPQLFVSQDFGVGAAVPEPSSWTSMIMGFGIIGGILRTRRQRANIRKLSA